MPAGTRDGERRSAVLVCAILGLAILGLVAFAYPGFMSFDSVWQLREARSGVFSDWHPPAMAALWRYVDMVIPGPLGMLLLQLGCFIAGTFLLARRFLRPIWAATFTLALAWFPPIALTMVVVWKDCQMAGFLMLGIALLVSVRRSPKLVGLALLFAAMTMRHNGFILAAAPIIAGFEWDWPTGWKRYALSTSVWIALTLAAFGTNRLLTDKPLYPWHGSVAIADIVGTVHYSSISDSELRASLEGVPATSLDDFQVKANAAYKARTGVFAILDAGLIRQPVTADERTAIAHAWRTLVMHHPFAYLRHRLSVAYQILAISSVGQLAWLGIDDRGADLATYDEGPVRLRLNRIALRLGRSFLARPIVYVVLILFALPFAIRRRDRVLAILGASALLSELALFLIAPTPDFRYSIWLVPVAAFVLIPVASAVRQWGSKQAPT